MKPGFDAHWFCVTQPTRGSITDVECYVLGDDKFKPCYDEIVVKEEKQVLPIAVVHFTESACARSCIFLLALSAKVAQALVHVNSGSGRV